MRNISIQLSDNTSNNVSGINRNSPSRGSIRILPPIVPNSEKKPVLRTNTSNVMHRTELEPKSFNQALNQTFTQTSGSPQNNLLATNYNDLGNKMFSHQYYDSNNYLSHINKCEQMSKKPLSVNQSAMGATNVSVLSGHLSSTSTTAVVNNGITSANLNTNSMSNSRGSLEDHGVDVGRVSPSSSSNDSRKSRYSSASLDSGRGSDTKTSGQSHRVSVHSCESLGSQSSNKDNYNRNSSSSSSIGSGNSATLDPDITSISTPTAPDPNWTPVSVGHSIAGPLSIPEMVLHGIADEEIIHSWLSRIHFEDYTNNFISAGYDMPTISRMTPEDLTAIGITKPNHRQILKTEIQKLSIADGIPNFKPNSLLDWLKLLRLELYFTTLCRQGYDSIDRVTELTWEDLEEIGISKLGHQKKIMIAIKAIKRIESMNRSAVPDAPNHLALPLEAVLTRAHNNSYQMPVNGQFQDTVPIQMFAPTKSTPSPTTTEKPITPQLKTFQQLPNAYPFGRQISEGQYYGVAPNEAQNPVFQSSRGRSLESLANTELNYYQMYPQRHAFNDLSHLRDQSSDQIHGYETDSELVNSYSNHRKGFYEMDYTATLNRPKGLIKAKPIAKIVAKTRQTDPNLMNHQMYCSEPQKNSSFDSTENNYIRDENESNYSQMYSNIKHKKTPPAPPKRINSMRQSSPVYAGPMIPPHRREDRSFDEFQEQMFGLCVKNLTNRFSINNNSDESIAKLAKESVDYSNDFPPPPSPLSFNECQNYNTLQRRPDTGDRESDRVLSSSSSNESIMPFANENIGTIKQRFNNDNEMAHKNMSSPTCSSIATSPSIATSAPMPQTIANNIVYKSQDISNKNSDSKLYMSSPTKQRTFQSCVESASKPIRADPLDDIETMLVNLSTELDFLLENNQNNRNN